MIFLGDYLKAAPGDDAGGGGLPLVDGVRPYIIGFPIAGVIGFPLGVGGGLFRADAPPAPAPPGEICRCPAWKAGVALAPRMPAEFLAGVA